MRRHPTDPVSLVFGLLFLGVALLWGTTGRGTLTRQSIIDEPGWRLPLLLVGVGTAGLVASLWGRRDDGS